MTKQKPYCTIIDNSNIVVVVFGNELNELMDYATDAGAPFDYVMGTDAWFEAQEMNGTLSLVARTHEKTYFSCPAEQEVLDILKIENGILVLLSKVELIAENIKQTSGLEELRDWIDTEIGEDKIEGLLFCFYTDEDKELYHN
jgi:hypothetical protein